MATFPSPLVSVMRFRYNISPAAVKLIVPMDQWNWLMPPVIGLSGGAISYCVMVVAKRWDVHETVKGQERKNQRRRHELDILVTVDDGGKNPTLDRLLVAGITKEALMEAAPTILRYGKLTVNLIGGGGRPLSQPQVQALAAELQLLDYAIPGIGNKPCSLTAKGRALFRGLAEL